MTNPPSPNGLNGRDEHGRFAPGNPGGPGSPLAAQTARLRSALISTITEDDLRAIAAQLVEQARKGNLGAIKILLDRVLGKVQEPDLIERIEALEESLGERIR